MACCMLLLCYLYSVRWWISVFDTTNMAFHFDGTLSQCSRTAWSLCFLLVRWSCLLRLWVGLRDRFVKQKHGVWQALQALATTFHSWSLQQPVVENFRQWNNYFVIIIVSMHDFLVIQFNYIDKQPFQEQLKPNFNWTASQLPFPLIWLSHSWIAFDDHTKQSQWDNHLQCDALLF